MSRQAQFFQSAQLHRTVMAFDVLVVEAQAVVVIPEATDDAPHRSRSQSRPSKAFSNNWSNVFGAQEVAKSQKIDVN